MKNVPFICLSDNCDVIDLSDEIRSCPGKTVDRTLLLFSMSEADSERLIEFCATPYGQSATPASDMTNCEFFNLKFHEYRFASVKKSCHGDGIITMFLYRDREDALKHSDNADRLLSTSERMRFNMFFSDFTDKDRFVNICEVASLISNTSELLISKGIVSANSLSVSVSPASPYTLRGESLNTYFLLSTFISLISVLDSVSISREIKVNVSGLTDSFEVSISTVSSDTLLPIFGSVNHVMSIASKLPGSYTDLAIASYCAEKCNLRISAHFSSEGMLSFKFSRMTEQLPPLEFKRPMGDTSLDCLISDVIRVISSVKKEQNKDKK